MTRRILVTDGSSRSDGALRMARAYARTEPRVAMATDVADPQLA